MKKIFFLPLFIVFIAGVFFITWEKTPTLTFIAEAGNVTVFAEIADSDAERQTGLMFRDRLGENDGMLFIFESEEELSFWMKNTLIPLDIIFTDSEGTIINIQHAVPCIADPCPLYPSGGGAQYVIEVNGGFTEKHGIRQGQMVIFSV